MHMLRAFAAAHRNSPTLTGFADDLPCIAGRLMQREINAYKPRYKPARPYVAILGGAKGGRFFRVAQNLINRGVVDTIAFVGVVGNMILWAKALTSEKEIRNLFEEH
ncbi:MAG: hypothetical protein Ct9H90mP14_0670 [Methanobacteriota archaeon]|nr:MAG: hypothetical protein Ct9H90mP14_0670 [Euryarchaeota archaeon]